MNKEVICLDNNTLIVSDENGHMSIRDNNEYTNRILKKENEIDETSNNITKLVNEIKDHKNNNWPVNLFLYTIVLPSCIALGYFAIANIFPEELFARIFIALYFGTNDIAALICYIGKLIKDNKIVKEDTKKINELKLRKASLIKEYNNIKSLILNKNKSNNIGVKPIVVRTVENQVNSIDKVKSLSRTKFKNLKN